MCLTCSSGWLWLGEPYACSASLCWLQLAVAATAAETGEEDRRERRDLIEAFQYLKGPTRKLERDFLQGHVVIGQGVMASN